MFQQTLRWLFTRPSFQAWLRPRLERASQVYEQVRGGAWADGAPCFYRRRLFTCHGWTLWLHTFVNPDNPREFHSHPGRAYRFILSGGYLEEVITTAATPRYPAIISRVAWFEGMWGRVDATMVHRIATTYHDSDTATRREGLAVTPAQRTNYPVYTLWLTGPRTQPTELTTI